MPEDPISSLLTARSCKLLTCVLVSMYTLIDEEQRKHYCNHAADSLIWTECLISKIQVRHYDLSNEVLLNL